MFIRQLTRVLFAPARFGIKRLASSSSKSVKVRFVSEEGTHEASGKIGDSLLDVVVNEDVPLDGFGACEGTLACCTCHVILEKAHLDRVPAATEEELDMLDLAPCLEETSRLGCQVKLTEQDLPEVTVQVPKMVQDARTMS